MVFNHKKFKEKYRKKGDELHKERNKLYYRRVISFFQKKGLLLGEPEKNLYIYDIQINEVLKASKIEPRVLEVFPALYLHYPKNFVGELPKDLEQIINDIKMNKIKGKNFQGLEYKKMLYWANLRLKDKRTKPQKEKKIHKGFRFSPQFVKLLEKTAKKEGKTLGDVIEEKLTGLLV